MSIYYTIFFMEVKDGGGAENVNKEGRNLPDDL